MNAEEYSERGGKYFSKKNFDGAIADYTEVIQLESNNPFAYCKRGMAYTQKKEFDLAIADFTEAIRLEPSKFGEFYFERGGAYIFKGNKDLAIADLEMAVKIDPQNENYRGALEDVKAVSSGNSSNSIRKKIGKLMLIGSVIGGIIGGLIGGTSYGLGAGIVGFLLGAFLGIGIKHSLIALVEEIREHFLLCLEVAIEEYHKEGFLSALGQFLIGFFIFGLWPLLKVFLVSLISPFITIYEFVTEREVF